LPLMVTLIITYKQRVTAIENATFDKLIAIRDLKVKQVESWLEERRSNLLTLSAENELVDLEIGFNENATNQYSYTELERVRRLLNNYQRYNPAIGEINLVNPSNGKILVSNDVHLEGGDISGEVRIGNSLESPDLKVGDIYYSKRAGKPSMIYTLPLFCKGHDGKHLSAILVARIDLQNSLYTLLLEREGLGKTGETLIVNKEVIALNELRWFDHAPLNLQINAEPAVHASQGKTGITKTEDYRGEPVLAAYTYIQETGWGFVCKQDLYELNEPIREMIANFIYLFIISTIMIYIVATYLARTISKPIVQMADLSTKIGEGDFSRQIESNAKDEMGALSQAIKKMSESIQSRIMVQNGVRRISDTILSPSTMEKFCSDLLMELMESTQANMGSFYILNELRSEFEHFTSIGGNPEMMGSFSSENPEGEFGLALSRKSIVHLQEIPEDTVFTFSTTAGKARPKEIITIPILVDDAIVALISLVNIHKFSKTAYDTLEQTWLSINMSYSSLLANLRTQVLAENLSSINQELEAQTEELQQQTEELETTSERLQDQNVELEMQTRQVEEANRLKGEFLSNMSHELRTPLNSVLALSNVLLNQTKERLTTEESDYLDIIVRNGKDLLKLINDILDLSKIEAGQMEVINNTFPLANSIHDIIDSLRPLADERGNTLEAELSHDQHEITSDQSMVHGILQNLIANAIKFTENGSITVTSIETQEEIAISVQDTGIGISEEALSHIFDEFRQSDGTTSRHYEGTGLGLTISSKSANLLGGNIHAESHLGKGSTFTFTMPKHSPLVNTSNQDHISTTTNLPANTKMLGKDSVTLLVVEDQDPAILQLKSILEPIGYTVDVARDGALALEYLEKRLPDGIILDLMMPEIDGFQVLDSIRSRPETSKIPVLILTAKDLTTRELNRLSANNIQLLIQKGDIDKDLFIKNINVMLGINSETQQMRANTREAPHPERLRKISKTKSDKLTVLIIEDNPDNMSSMKAILHAGYSILEATEGNTGLEMIVSHEPDLVLMDIMLPGMDGMAVLQKVRADKNVMDIPLIAVTAKAMKGDRETILAAGFDDFISKPVEADELRKKIESFLAV